MKLGNHFNISFASTVKFFEQWLTGLNLRLNDLFESYFTAWGGQTKLKPLDFSISGPVSFSRG